MASTQRYYHSSHPISMPSKAPTTGSPLYPISRVTGVSPPDYSDASTTAGSRTSGGTFSANSSSYAGSSSEYESSSAGYSGVDVVDMLSDRMNTAFDSVKLDKGLATQAQT